MDTSILTPEALFQKSVRYTVPPFQRPYVWDLENQWEPLWDDVRNTAESYLNELDRFGDDSVKAQLSTHRHFLGAVVIQQIHVPTREIERREVIDGQQRITTLQLLLDAIQYVCEKLELEFEAELLSTLVTNTGPLVRRDVNHAFKLWPTTGDRDAFRHAMDNGLATDDFENSLIVQAHEYFQDQAREWIGADQNSAPRRAEALQTAVTTMLQIVVIDLTPQDDPHVIFETLNARGTPLLEYDLIKNYSMSRFGQVDQGDIWSTLDVDWWREEVGRGNQSRPRIETVLSYWLAMRTAREVSPSRVFNEFRTHAEKLPIEEVISDLIRDLENYRRFEEGKVSSGEITTDEEMFRYRTQAMQVGVITPALLLLHSVSYEKRFRSFQALESFLIRRMVCRATTKDYNRLAIDLVGELHVYGLDDADKVVVEFLKRQTAESRVWPDDHALADSLDTLMIYKRFPQYRTRMLLEAIEEGLRKSPMTEYSDAPKGLPIEHVMPQSWRRNWPLSDGVADEPEAIADRNRLIHTIGNLTLVNTSLNSTLKNASWESKRDTLGKHTVLRLNHRLLDESEGKDWDENFIQARSKRMAKLIAEVWPGPDSPVWD